MITKVSNLYTIPLPPGKTTFKNPGRHWALVDCPVALGVKVGEMPEIQLTAGDGFSFDAPDFFDRYELNNPTAAVLTVRFWCGFVAYKPNRVNLIEAPTEIADVADVVGVYVGDVLAANAALNLTGAVVAPRLRRKAVQVANMDPASNIEFRDGADRILLPVRPGETITQPVSGFIRIKNPTGAPISCLVSEIWWTS